MALQVWLPLTKDLKNQGLLPISTWLVNNWWQEDNGKLGKCYGGSGLYHIDTEWLGNQWSLACWVKSTGWGQYNDILICKNLNSSDNCQFYLSIVGGNTFNIGVNGGSSTSQYNYTFNTNTWYHLCCTYDGKEIKQYLNGALVKTLAYTSTQKTGMVNLGINTRSTNDAGTETYGWSGNRLNDVRIYDHCLSEMEVKKLAKGLVLHYPLNDEYIEGTTNLASSGAGGWNNSGAATRNSNDISIPNAPTPGPTYSLEVTTAGNCAMTCGTSTSNLPSKTLTFSVWYWQNSTQNGNTVYIRSNKTDGNVGDFEYNGSANPSTWPKNKWIRLVKTITTASDATTFYFCTYVDPLGSKRAYNGWQIEEKDHATPWTVPGTTRAASTIEYDISGFCNNGIRSGIFSWSGDAPKYGINTYFGGSSCIDTNIDYLGNEWSYGCWIYSPTSSRGWEGVLMLNGTNPADADLQFGFYTYPGGNKIQNSANGKYNASISYSYGSWHHLFGTYDGATLKTYIDGELVNSTSITQAHLERHNLVIGARHGNGTNHDCFFQGNISDVRVYATALSADDVKALYQNEAYIDSSGNIYGKIRD